MLADGSTYPHRGSVLAVDRDVDPKMGTIRVSATFPNPGNVLRPGQYGRVRAQTAVDRTRCWCRSARWPSCRTAFSCASLTPDNMVEIRTVTLGRRIGDRWIVEKGLQTGDRVIVDAPSLKDGTQVVAAPSRRIDRGPLMSRFFIRRPIVAIVIAIVTVLGGVVAMGGLPIAQFPQIVPPQIVVTATVLRAPTRSPSSSRSRHRSSSR